ncbi:MAG TPA: hypothetical protein VKB95_10940 [Chitinophagaceae bacterium]|nr:hypothetical protein [Chitinophagaceae bacterium]
MEVHAHTHTERKKWTHYLWEFLMLFLAVFAGFLAENQREHIVEHQREKVLMKSMLKDLQADTTIFSGTIRGISLINEHIDSLIPLLSNNNDLNKKATEIYQQEVWVDLYYKLIYTDRTIEQLKNSGNFRLIRNNLVSDAIIQYDGYVRNFVLAMQDEAILFYYRKADDIRDGIFKSAVFGNWIKGFGKINIIQLPPAPYFLSTDRKQVDTYINLLGKYSAANSWFIQNVQSAIKTAKTLDLLIKKEYHLQ